MNTDDSIEAHSIEKLTLYEGYLSIYLNIILQIYPSVRVFDLFAGRGYDSKGVKGSAVRAAEIIDAIRIDSRYKNKKLKLILNEIDGERFQNLSDAVKGFSSFVNKTNSNANEIIAEWNSIPSNHDFFFIDPFGYSSLENENLQKIISATNAEVLMFLPLSSFERLKGSLSISQAATMKNYYKNIGINEDQVTSDLDAKSLLRLIVSGFKRCSKSEYVQSHIFENRSNGNRYALIFVSHHSLGRDKFLEAKSKMLRMMHEKVNPQLGLGFLEMDDFEVINELCLSSKSLTNTELYELAANHGYHSSRMTELIKRLEKEGKVSIASISGDKRRKNAFYLRYDSREVEHLIYRFGDF